MNLKNKNGVVPVVGAMLLIVISSIVGLVVFSWTNTFQSSFNAKNAYSGNIGDLDLLALTTNGATQSQLTVKNTRGSYHIIENVFVNSTDCLILDTNVIDDIDVLNLNCSVTQYRSYEIEIYSDKGTYTNFLTVLE